MYYRVVMCIHRTLNVCEISEPRAQLESLHMIHQNLMQDRH
jgi:hypothetical protein